MGVDAVLKRYFPAIVCALIALAAYFQASGMGQLVAASVAVDPSAVPAAAPAPKAVAPAPASTDHVTSSTAILARNPFDSVTGPLDGSAADLSVPTAPPVARNDNDWDDDPPCDSGKVLLIAASDDREWSFASIAGSDGKSVLKREGDEFAGGKIAFIGGSVRPDGYHPAVWLTTGTSRCQMEVGGKEPVKKAATPTVTPEKPATGKGKKVPAEIAAKIHKISETQFDVERSVVDTILENQAELMRSARIVPEKEGDKVVGIRLFGVRSDSLLGTLGLENGDRLSAINGFEMASPEKALEAYARLRTADHLTVSVNRRGKDMNIDFNIK